MVRFGQPIERHDDRRHRKRCQPLAAAVPSDPKLRVGQRLYLLSEHVQLLVFARRYAVPGGAIPVGGQQHADERGLVCPPGDGGLVVPLDGAGPTENHWREYTGGNAFQTPHPSVVATGADVSYFLPEGTPHPDVARTPIERPSDMQNT